MQNDKFIFLCSLNELLPFSSDGFDHTVFSSAAEVYNRNFQATTSLYAEDATETPFRFITVGLDLLQSAVISYLYYRMNGVAATVLALGNNIPMVRARSVRSCDMPLDIYIYLWVIIAIGVLSLLPKIIKPLHRLCKDVYDERIELAAQRLRLEEVI